MNLNYFNNLVEQKLLATHTCYLGKVTRVNGNFADVQPLSLIKAVSDTSGTKQALVPNVPISQTVLRVLTDGENLVGATVIVICAERDITQTRKGNFALPSLRRHSLSDSIIIGCLNGKSGTSEDDVTITKEEFRVMLTA